MSGETRATISELIEDAALHEVEADLYLLCGHCDANLCAVDAGDTLGTLGRVVADHLSPRSKRPCSPLSPPAPPRRPRMADIVIVFAAIGVIARDRDHVFRHARHRQQPVPRTLRARTANRRPRVSKRFAGGSDE